MAGKNDGPLQDQRLHHTPRMLLQPFVVANTRHGNSKSARDCGGSEKCPERCKNNTEFRTDSAALAKIAVMGLL
jgi:hypothetical protein